MEEYLQQMHQMTVISAIQVAPLASQSLPCRWWTGRYRQQPCISSISHFNQASARCEPTLKC